MARALELVCLLRLLGAARAMIPLPCASLAHIWARECCPEFWRDGSPCGSASGRGGCQAIAGIGRQGGGSDLRAQWPSYFFRRLCVCRGNYGGADCGECKYGWHGGRCQFKNVVVRRDLGSMPRRERLSFIQRLDLSKRTLSKRYAIYASVNATPGAPMAFRRATVYNIAAYLHYLCSKTVTTRQGANYAHRGPAFITWHRMFNVHLEQEIRNITGDDSFFIANWVWQGNANCDVCTDDLFGRSQPDSRLSPDSIFSSWRSYCTNDGVLEGSMSLVCPLGNELGITRQNRWNLDIPPSVFRGLPSWQDYYACLNISLYDSPPYNVNSRSSFRCALEGFIDPLNPTDWGICMHNAVHVFCGGTLLFSHQAANDPLFTSIHVNVDKIFEYWRRRHPRSQYPRGEVPIGHGANDYLVGFIPLHTNAELFEHSVHFGYDYEYP
ncbi:tyrosinase-like [Mustelus asterias]